MPEDPCRALRDKTKLALIAWQNAEKSYKNALGYNRFLSSQQDFPIFDLVDIQKIRLFKREEEEYHEKFIEAYEMWIQCIKKSQKA
jgi:glutaredoxin 2